MAKRRTGLGRGLSALIPADSEGTGNMGKPAESEEVSRSDGNAKRSRSASSKGNADKRVPVDGPEGAGDAFTLNISLIEPNPDQPRSQFDEEQLEELAASIRKNGLLQPILVRAHGNAYQIVAGERRWQACRRIGLKEVPAIVIEADDTHTLELALIENIQRSDLNPMEEAYGYQALMDRTGMTQAKIAETVSKGRSTIANSLRLLDLPEEAQKMLLDGGITAGHARAILSIPTEEGRRLLVRKLHDEKLSVRAAENLARLYSGKVNDQGKRQPAPSTFKRAAKELRDYLGAEVKVKTAGGKNRIEISFADEADLQRLFKKMTEGENR